MVFLILPESIFQNGIHPYPPDLPENKQAIEKIDLLRELWGHTETICRLIKYDFYQLMISRYIVHWYHFVAENWSGGNPQAVIRGNKPPKNYIEPILRLRKYPDFARAEEFMYGYDESVDSAISGGDLEVFKLQSDIDKFMKTLAKIEETSRQKENKAVSFYCEYCNSYHEFDDLKVRKTCGSPECEKKLDAQRKQTERALKLSDFVAGFDGKPKRCMVCKYKRVVNAERVCQPCLDERV
jgi:type IV secretory pathway VirB4 component